MSTDLVPLQYGIDGGWLCWHGDEGQSHRIDQRERLEAKASRQQIEKATT